MIIHSYVLCIISKLQNTFFLINILMNIIHVPVQLQKYLYVKTALLEHTTKDQSRFV